MEHKAVIFRHGQKCRIAGGQVAVNQGDIVQFYNSTGGHAVLSFDDKKPDEGDFELADGGMDTRKFEKEGKYPYTVTVTIFKDGKKEEHEAEASKPIVIVYP